TLDLRDNQLSSVPAEIVQLSQLTTLNLSSNQLSSVPEWVRDLPKLVNLHLLGNPIAIPPEILGNVFLAGDLATIFRFAFAPETQPLYEAKLIIVGDGSAGKTTLANKLKNPDYELQPEEKSTEGIDLIPWEIDHPNGNPLRTKIWDFGGQQIYHSTHQFFLTERSVYILVADTRKENTDFYYWLRVVETLSNGSPVIVVKNEKQNRQCDLDERSLRAEFLNLKEILAVNLADNRGLAELQNTLQNYLCHLPHVGMNVPIPWANIRAVLENLSQNHNFITRDRYFELCRNNGFDTEKEMLVASKFLHDLGICLHFQNVRGLRKLLILKPTWATGSIYKILDHKQIKADFGRFNDDDLETIWDEGDAAKMRDELLDLMMHFGLCYEIPNRRGHYISPQLLEKESLDYAWDDRDNLVLRYEYTFKPKDIFPRFVVAVHEIIENQALVWRHGVVLTDGYARAEIIEEDRYHKAEIKIRVSGTNKRDLLSYVARELEKISNTYDRIDYETYIPCNCATCKNSPKPHTYTWENLRRRLQNKRYEVECELSYVNVNVRSLLDDIAVPQLIDRDDDSMMLADRTARSSPFSPTVIVNYQNPQQTMTQNTGRTINTGGGDYRENHITGSNAQYAERDIVNNHNPSPTETAELLKTWLKDLDLSSHSDQDDLKDELLYQPPAQQNQIWDWMDNVSRNSDTRDEAIKTFAEVLGSLFGLPGTIIAGTFKVAYTALTKAKAKRNELPANYENPFDASGL
ncbi:MAG: hypothetical protein HC795_18555, partial [Coleofasciculaceae cyanobacterium RL_1_1]|nr:hypothetical protein [Coleofasciculaceae cyanobacterium RL_1_1]